MKRGTVVGPSGVLIKRKRNRMHMQAFCGCCFNMTAKETVALWTRLAIWKLWLQKDFIYASVTKSFENLFNNIEIKPHKKVGGASKPTSPPFALSLCKQSIIKASLLQISTEPGNRSHWRLIPFYVEIFSIRPRFYGLWTSLCGD